MVAAESVELNLAAVQAAGFGRLACNTGPLGHVQGAVEVIRRIIAC
jgi:hypothetical protein